MIIQSRQGIPDGTDDLHHDRRPAATRWEPGRCRPDPDGGWSTEWVAVTGSTHDDLVRAAAGGAPDRTVLVADSQSAGRGRMDRQWLAPPGAALTFSTLLRPDAVPTGRWGWVGALLAMAVGEAISRRSGLTTELKWPNDVMLGGCKVAGILAASTGSALVAGAGINVTVTAADLPRGDATSLSLAGAPAEALGREELLAAVLDAFAARLSRWTAARGDVDIAGLRDEYRSWCATIGAAVTIHLPIGPIVTGTAVDVSADGGIVIDTGSARRTFLAGDVVHLRPAPEIDR